MTSRPQPSPGFRSLAPAIHRGSTVVFDRLGDVVDDWRPEAGYNYGLYGTPTTLELGLRVAALEGARHTFVVPGGQAALALVYLAYCRAGSHALVPASVYGPNAEIGGNLLAGLDIEVEAYDPLIGAGIAALIRPNTALVWCESPGSITMEVQDVPALVAAAHARAVPVALDNTYAAGVLFDAFAHGVDVSVQALTKYVGGHSDLLLGTVSVGHDAAYEAIGRVWRLIGMAVSPDDCALALRGLLTLGVRLERLERSTLAVARWLGGGRRWQKCCIRPCRGARGTMSGGAISPARRACSRSSSAPTGQLPGSPSSWRRCGCSASATAGAASPAWS